MKNRKLLIGSGSTIAKSLIDSFSQNQEFITYSRDPAGEKDKHYVHNSFTDGLLEDFEINFLGAARIIKTYLKNLLKSDKARVVLISSVAAAQGLPYHSSIVASNSASEEFTRAMAADCLFCPNDNMS